MKARHLVRLADPVAEIANRNHGDRIDEIQKAPFTGARILSNITLADGVATSISHGLDRLPMWVCPSAPRGPSATGRIEEVRDGQHDRTKTLVLKATGWGATITVDVAVA